MITQECYLDEWVLKVFYEVDSDDADVVLKELYKVDCDPDAYRKAADLIESDALNQGFTYTDDFLKITFIIITKTTSAAEFQSTFDHEKGHAAMHIAEYYRIDPHSEEFQYLQGRIGKRLFEVAKQFLCDHCRLNFYNYGKIKIKI